MCIIKHVSGRKQYLKESHTTVIPLQCGFLANCAIDLELGPIECLRLCQCYNDHFRTRQQVIRHVTTLLGYQLCCVQNLEQATLPKAEKKHSLHRQKLIKRIEWLQSLLCCHIEEH